MSLNTADFTGYFSRMKLATAGKFYISVFPRSSTP